MKIIAANKLVATCYTVLVLVTVAQSQGRNIAKQDSACPLSVYLTFDDGPMVESRHLLSLISADTCNIDVFFVGQHAYATLEQWEILQQFRNNPLVEVGNHSFSHANKKYKTFYSQPGKAIKDITLNKDILSLSNKLVRLPGRNVWRLGDRQRTDLEDARLVADSLASKGYVIFGWDLEWRYDTASHSCNSAEYLIQCVKQMTEAGKTFTMGTIVILCHDQMLKKEKTRQELQLFLRRVKATPGWKFDHLSNYPGACQTTADDFFH